MVLARTPLDELERETGLRLASVTDDDEIDTLGGLVFMLAGRVPARGEIVTHDSGVQFEVVDADPRRIKRVRLRVPDVNAPSG
jgi:magnesium and cobalt transporter